MSNNFKFILFLYFFPFFFCSAAGLETTEEAAHFQTISFTRLSGSSRPVGSIIVKRDAFSEAASQRPSSLKNNAVFLVDVFNGPNSLGTVTSAVDPNTISIFKYFVGKQEGLRREFLVSWKNSAKYLNCCVVKVVPSTSFVNNSSGESPYKLKINLMLANFSSKKDDASGDNASLFLEKVRHFLKSRPVFKITTGELGDPETLEDLSFYLFKGPRNIMLLGSEVMRDIAHIAFGSWSGFYILHLFALDPEFALKSLSFPMFPMIIDEKDETIVVENEAKRAALDMNADASYSQNEPDSDLKNNQPLDASLVLAPPVVPEKKSVFNPNHLRFFLASYQMLKDTSKMKKITSKESMSSPVASQAFPVEETMPIGEFFVAGELARQETKRERLLFSLLHQQHQGWSEKTQEHSGGGKAADPLDAFLSLFKGFFETVWGHLIVQIG